MDTVKEFEGKTLDEAIREACVYFDLPREKLEIDIVHDAKSGIFGLVGTRKAAIRARRAHVSARVDDILGAPRREPAHAAEWSESASPGNDFRPQAPAREDSPRDGHDADKPAVPLDSLDQDELRSAVYSTACRLIRPIVPDADLEVTIGSSRIAVHIDSDEDLGLLIGREGQTLASIQYVAARIVARLIGVPVRIHLDAGDYRERQDGRLREMALALADRVRFTGRVSTTRPLSSYQRRIVHMTLQDDPSVMTRSSGEGPLKRVVIQRSRPD